MKCANTISDALCVMPLSPVSQALHTVCPLGFGHGVSHHKSMEPWLCNFDEDTANLGQRAASFHY